MDRVVIPTYHRAHRAAGDPEDSCDDCFRIVDSPTVRTHIGDPVRADELSLYGVWPGASMTRCGVLTDSAVVRMTDALYQQVVIDRAPPVHLCARCVVVRGSWLQYNE